MRNILLFVTVVLFALAGAGACSDNSVSFSSRHSETAHDGNSSDVAGREIDSMLINATLISAERAYAFVLDGEQYWLTIDATAEWPRRIGNNNLAALQDTLVGAAFPMHSGQPVEKAITAYLSDTTGIINAPAEIVSPVSVPDTSPNVWSIMSHVERVALSNRYVTYFVVSSSYMGGAHPSTAVTPVTYSFADSCAVTPSSIFVAGSNSALLKVISDNLALQLGCRPDNFRSAGLFEDTLPMPSGMYVDNNGLLVFQYGQYEIGPYSMGIIRVTVSPMAVSRILTPMGQALLLAGN